RSARQAGGIGADRRGGAQGGQAGGIFALSGRGPRFCAAGEPSEVLCGRRSVPGKAPERRPGGAGAGGESAEMSIDPCPVFSCAAELLPTRFTPAWPCTQRGPEE